LDLIKLLKTTFLCRDLDLNELEDLANITSIRHALKGEVLFSQGDQAFGFYILLEGSVRIYKSSPDGKEYTLHHIRSGQMFAEAAIFGSTTFPANCIATNNSSIAFFPKDKFVQLITRSPQMSLKMIAALSNFVREFNQQIENLSLREVPARLATHLLGMAEQSGTLEVTLTMNKTELARSLGTISETLSRNLKRMSNLNLIRVDGKNILISDKNGLQSVADGKKI